MINVAIIGNEKSILEESFTLFIPGGPGCSYAGFVPVINQVIASGKNKNKNTHNLILFDPLGCGESDDAIDKNDEYTMVNFAEIAAQVVEQIQSFLNIPKMNLQVWGTSFGAMITMLMPVTRPNWLTSDSKIKLQLLVPEVVLNGSDTYENIIPYVKEHYQNHPQFSQLLDTLERDFSNQIEPTRNAQLEASFITGVLYSNQDEKMLSSFQGKLLKKYYSPILSLIRFLNEKVHYSDDLKSMLAMTNEFNFEQASLFAKKRFDRVNLKKLVDEFSSLYSQIPTCFIGGEQDPVCNPKSNADVIQSNFSNMVSIVFNSKHRIAADRPEYYKIMHDLIFSRYMDETYLNQLKLNPSHGKMPSISRLIYRIIL